MGRGCGKEGKEVNCAYRGKLVGLWLLSVIDISAAWRVGFFVFLIFLFSLLTADIQQCSGMKIV